MKKKSFIHILIYFTLTLFSQSVFCQAPQAIPYQAIARDNTGAILSNQAISLRFSLHDGASSGAIVYQEIQNVTTNNLGLFSINLGQGTVVSGAMTIIDWKNGSKYLQVELDPTGGTTYTDMGTTQLMSVPFALHAGSADDTKWTESGNDISNANIGNVGIGTNAPITKLEVKWTTPGGAEPIARIYQHNCGNACAQPSGSALQLINDNPSDPDNGGRLTFAEPINITNNDEGAASIHLAERTSLTGNGGLAFSTRNSMNVFGERMRISKEGNMGIGIAVPGAKLHINDVNGIQNAPSADLVLSRVWNNSLDTRASSVFHYYSTTTGNDNLAFGVSGGGGTDNAPNSLSQIKMMIQGDGKVGIGTMTPSNKLTVEGDLRVNAGGYGIVQYDGIVSMGSYIDGSAGWFGTNSNHPLNFYTANGWESMTITTGGNIGLGTTIPANKLSVIGNADISGNVGIGTSTPNEKLSVTGTTGLYGNTVISPSQSGSLGTVSIGTPNLFANSMLNIKSNLQYGAFIDGANTGSAALYVTGITRLDGEVGINVAPSSVYQLAVGGKIVCTELRVQAMPFPDYVFDPSYKLKPLEEVEEHILAHHRLPNMPPATQVESEGMNVGGIQLKLVEKVEELTLYLLQQQKELKAQKEEIDNMKMLLNNSKN